MSVLDIKNLEVSINEKQILKGLNLEIKSGEIHAVMGPNGAGKSTLASAIMGHPKYEVDGGSILLDGEEVLELTFQIDLVNTPLELQEKIKKDFKKFVKSVKVVNK